MVDVVDRANRKICVTLLRYSVDKPESAQPQVQLSARNKQDAKFLQLVYVECKLEDFIFLPDVTNSVYKKIIKNQQICIVLYFEISNITFLSISFLFESG